jgi:hypothetical protein
MEIGLETECREYSNITFRHCHVLRGGNTTCDIQNGDCAEVHHITFEDMKGLIEIAHADPYVPSMSLSKVMKEELPDNIDRRIFIYERGSQFDLLSKNPETFMWVSLVPDSVLERYQLTEKVCVDNTKIYKDVLVYRNGYKLSMLDKQFITALCEAKRKYL